MDVGNIVMFKPEGTYAKWFGGQLGTVESARYNKKGELYLRVRWMSPVKYHDKYASFSHFAAANFVLFDNE